MSSDGKVPNVADAFFSMSLSYFKLAGCCFRQFVVLLLVIGHSNTNNNNKNRSVKKIKSTLDVEETPVTNVDIIQYSSSVNDRIKMAVKRCLIFVSWTLKCIAI